MGTRFVRVLTRFDSFSEPVMINYKGESKFKTFGGALVSILTAAIVLAYGSRKFIQLVDRADPNIINLISRLSPDDKTLFPLSQYHFEPFIGIGVRDGKDFLDIDVWRHFSIKVS